MHYTFLKTTILCILTLKSMKIGSEAGRNKTKNYMTWEDATRLACDSNELKVYENKLYGDEDESKSNDTKGPSFGFTTEVFCLTLESLHLGFNCIYSELTRLQRHIDRLRREARQNPMAAFMINMNVQNLEKRLLAQIAHLMEQRVCDFVLP